MRKLLASIIAVMICNVCIYAQTSIKGKVTDRNGLPLENVSVKEKGGTAGTTTDRDGNYTINASGCKRYTCIQRCRAYTTGTAIKRRLCGCVDGELYYIIRCRGNCGYP